ncbi:hypothetical protein B0H19DRAFT_1262012 [Mycena capillaripes]|nr:hypothetical protein B0H19DRAFT_1262012 [Mycena capillaripes]
MRASAECPKCTPSPWSTFRTNLTRLRMIPVHTLSIVAGPAAHMDSCVAAAQGVDRAGYGIRSLTSLVYPPRSLYSLEGSGLVFRSRKRTFALLPSPLPRRPPYSLPSRLWRELLPHCTRCVILTSGTTHTSRRPVLDTKDGAEASATPPPAQIPTYELGADRGRDAVALRHLHGARWQVQLQKGGHKGSRRDVPVRGP